MQCPERPETYYVRFCIVENHNFFYPRKFETLKENKDSTFYNKAS